MRWHKHNCNEYKPSSVVPGQERDTLQRRSFHDVIDMTNSLLLGTSHLTEKAAIFDFVIWALGQQIAADGHGLFVSGKRTPENCDYNLYRLFPSLNGTKQGIQEFDISKFPTYTGPWDRSRFPNGIQSIFSRGFRHEQSDSKGIFFKELNFAVMLEGRHHTSWGIFTGECVQPLEIISLEPYFSKVTTDGAYFHYTDKDGNLVLKKGIDYRLAAMYRLAQMKWEAGYPMDLTHRLIENRQQLREEAQKRFQAESQSKAEMTLHHYIDEQSALYNRIFGLEQEIGYWKQQCSVKDQRIKELEKSLSSSK